MIIPSEASEQPTNQLELTHYHLREWEEHFRQQRESWRTLKQLHAEQRAEFTQAQLSVLERASMILAQTRDMVSWQHKTASSRIAVRERQEQELSHLV